MYYYLIVILMTISLTACSSNTGLSLTDAQTIRFDRYGLKWDASYQVSNPVAIDNQQVLHQILGVYQAPGEGFTKNLIISSSKIKEGLDALQFMTVNANKLNTEIQGLISDGYETIDLECDNEDIVGYLHQLHLIKDQQTHYMSQLYLIHQGQGYIISAYTDTQDDLEQYRKYFKSLTCVASA